MFAVCNIIKNNTNTNGQLIRRMNFRFVDWVIKIKK